MKKRAKAAAILWLGTIGEYLAEQQDSANVETAKDKEVVQDPVPNVIGNAASQPADESEEPDRQEQMQASSIYTEHLGLISKE